MGFNSGFKGLMSGTPPSAFHIPHVSTSNLFFFYVEREEENHALVGLLGRAGHSNDFILVSHWLLSMWNLKVRQ